MEVNVVEQGRRNRNLEHAFTVVIPTLNEEKAIGPVLEEVLGIKVPRDYILVVDGGSTDRTVDIAMKYGVKVIRQEGKGKADAIRTALKYVDTPYMLVMDGDYTYPAMYIPELLKTALETNSDEVIGVRMMSNGNQSLIYRFGNWLLTNFFNLIFDSSLHDVLSGMYLVRVDALRDALMEMKSFSVEAEIAAHMVSTGKTITEIPIEYRKRLGDKKLGIKDGLFIFRDIIRLAMRYNPMFLLFFMGALLIIPGLLLGAYVGYWYIFYGIKYYLKGLIAIMLFLIGLQFLGMAMLSLYIKRMEYRLRKAIESLHK
ncbi:glycosyl transferase, family 2 [Vulcanisaeta moutnovskia 768-28]|uniref:Glycosyl transferase, family 2 n=1 Tax=Vulcanisaeta moutnovskia (strain 768-28) TaxID=985053 RepID=F0QXT5_VULM7|nr:glycosyl transferase, family 2 [Vulcanisaeta moutnovskia 768-28]